MYFDSFAAFLDMGGHGLYVWLAYGLALVIFSVTLLLPVLSRRQFDREMKRRIRREELEK